MADQQNNVAINITDGVAPTIIPKLKDISTISRVASTGIKGLQTALNQINGNGLQGLKVELAAISRASQQLATTTTRMGQAAFSASSGVDKLANSYRSLNTNAAAAILTLQQLATAAQGTQVPINNLGSATRNAVNGTRSMGGANMMAASTLSVLEGRTLGSNRAVARLLIDFAGLGNIIRFAFPVVGAIALIGVLDMMYQKVQKIGKAYKDLVVGQREAELAELRTGGKTLTIKPSGDFDLNAAKVLADDYTAERDLKIQTANYTIQQIEFQKQLADAVASTNEKGLQGDALAKQQIKTAQDRLSAERSANQELIKRRDTLQRILEDSKTVTSTVSNPMVPGAPPITFSTEVHLVNDPKQVKEVTTNVEQLNNAIRESDHQVLILGEHLKAAIKKEPLAAIKDETKAAVKQMQYFNHELKLAGEGTDVLTPRRKLAILEQQHTRALPSNKVKIENEEATVNQEIDRQLQERNLILATADERYKSEVEAIGLYSNALKIQADADKIAISLLKNKAELTPEQLAQEKQKLAAIKQNITAVIEQARYQSELGRLYEQGNGPLLTWKATVDAANKLLKDHAITLRQYDDDIRLAGKSYADATHPLQEYTHSLQDEINLFGKFGQELAVTSEVQKIQNELRQQGKVLTDEETSKLTTFLNQVEHQKRLNSELNSIYQQQNGLLEQLYLRQQALLQQKIQDRAEIAKTVAAIANQNLLMHQQVNIGTLLKGSTAQIIADYRGVAAGLTDIFGRTFKTLGDGFADSLGRALVYGQNLGDALKDVARQGLSEIISGLIKLGIQYVISEALLKSIDAANLAATTALATATATAWAPAAALASLATLGTNAGAADAALLSTFGLAEGLALFHFAGGGSVWGKSGVDKVPSMLTDGEFVVNSRAADSNRGLLEAINSGYKFYDGGFVNRSYADRQYNPNISNHSNSVNIEVVHDGSTGVKVERIDENRIRVIAKQAVHEHAPNVIAHDLQNPNSRTSKSVARNIAAPRKR